MTTITTMTNNATTAISAAITTALTGTGSDGVTARKRNISS